MSGIAIFVSESGDIQVQVDEEITWLSLDQIAVWP